MACDVVSYQGECLLFRGGLCNIDLPAIARSGAFFVGITQVDHGGRAYVDQIALIVIHRVLYTG